MFFRVTLVHSHEEVLGMMGDSFALLATRQLEKIGIELILSDRVVDGPTDGEITVPTGKITLASKKVLDADVYLCAHAIGGNATFLPTNSKTARDYAKVNSAFQVEGLSNVFAFGDW
jgi:NADH dehydrogenase FAD-containing subunit